MKTLLIALLLPLFAACTQIDTGNVGVQRVAGQIKSDILPAGWHVTGTAKVTEVQGKEQLFAFDDMHPQTAENIILSDLDVDIYIQTNTAKATAIMARWPNDLLDVKGEDGTRIGANYVTRQAREAIYKEIAKYKSDTVHQKRDDITAGLVKSLQASLDADAGKDWFFVKSANVRNLVVDPALTKSIQATAQRQYDINAKEKEIELATREAQRKRIEAQGDADVIRIKAQSLQAQGGDDYVRLEAIKKWDGKLPTTTGGVVPFINVK